MMSACLITMLLLIMAKIVNHLLPGIASIGTFPNRLLHSPTLIENIFLYNKNNIYIYINISLYKCSCSINSLFECLEHSLYSCAYK